MNAQKEAKIMNYVEFSHLERIEDENNKFCPGFRLPTGEIFFIEPAFYTQLTNFKTLYNETDFNRICKKMIELAKERKHIIYAYDFENPFMQKDGYIYLEFIDICDLLKIQIEDKSRGSDYGD